jgi:hypothetical protein
MNFNGLAYYQARVLGIKASSAQLTILVALLHFGDLRGRLFFGGEGGKPKADAKKPAEGGRLLLFF